MNEFTTKVQTTIYSYFAETYGTVENDRNKSSDQYNNMNIKDLKKELRELKKNPQMASKYKISAALSERN